MSRRTPWKRLIEHFADGRKPCNCGEAYLTNCGEGAVSNGDGTWTERHDMPVCESGCSANQIRAKKEIGLRVVKLLGLE